MAFRAKAKRDHGDMRQAVSAARGGLQLYGTENECACAVRVVSVGKIALNGTSILRTRRIFAEKNWQVGYHHHGRVAKPAHSTGRVSKTTWLGRTETGSGGGVDFVFLSSPNKKNTTFTLRIMVQVYTVRSILEYYSQ